MVTKRLIHGEIKDMKFFEPDDGNFKDEEEEEEEYEEEDNEEDRLFKVDSTNNMGRISKKKREKLSVVKKLVRESLENSMLNTSIKSLKNTSYIWILVTLGIARIKIMKF